MNKTALDQYEEVVNDALNKCSAKLQKFYNSIHSNHDFLYDIAKKDNFHPDEALLRQLLERKFDWMEFNHSFT